MQLYLFTSIRKKLASDPNDLLGQLVYIFSRCNMCETRTCRLGRRLFQTLMIFSDFWSSIIFFSYGEVSNSGSLAIFSFGAELSSTVTYKDKSNTSVQLSAQYTHMAKKTGKIHLIASLCKTLFYM